MYFGSVLWWFLAGLVPSVPLVGIVVAQLRQIRAVEASNGELAATLGDLARVEHGLAPVPVAASQVPDGAPGNIYAELEEFMTARHEWEDDPSLRQDGEQLGGGVVPPGFLDSAGDDEMT